MIGRSHFICIPNLGSIGPVVSEIQNIGNVGVGVGVVYEDGGGLIRDCS